MAKITYADKVGITPRTVHINQVWDDDMTEIKNVVNGLDDSVNQIGAGDFQPIFVSAIWDSLLIFDCTADSYPINNIYYSAPAVQLTLSASDATLDRIDLIVAKIPVDPAVVGTIQVIEGTLAASAVVVPPDFDRSTYFVIKQILVKANATTPDGTFSTEVVYADGTGEPNEWTFASSAASIVNSGGIIDATTPVAGDKATMMNNATISGLNSDKEFSLSFDITLKSNPTTNYQIVIKLLDSSGHIITQPKYIPNNTYGFDRADTAKQTIIINGRDFVFTNIADVWGVQIYPYLTFSGYELDNITFNIGSDILPPSGSIPTKTSDLTNDGSDGINPFITALDADVNDNVSKVIYVNEDDLAAGGSLESRIATYINTLNYDKEDIFADVWIEFLDNSVIFSEDLGLPDEWDIIVSSGASVVSSNPYSGTKSLDIAGATSTITLQNSSEISNVDSKLFKIWIKLKGTAATNWAFNLTPKTDGVSAGSTLELTSSFDGGFDRTNLDYQQVTFDLTLLPDLTFNELELLSTNLTSGAYTDFWTLPQGLIKQFRIIDTQKGILNITASNLQQVSSAQKAAEVTIADAAAQFIATEVEGALSEVRTLVDLNSAKFLIIAFSDETTAIDATTGKVTFTMPNFATTLTGIAVSFVTAPTTSAITIDVNEGGTSILSTKITVDATEFTSETAATPPVISDSALAANAIMSVDVDTADSGGTSAGGKLIIYFTRT